MLNGVLLTLLLAGPADGDIARLWPADAPPPPATLKPYAKTAYNQYIAIRDGADHHAWIHRDQDADLPGNGEANGNRRFPWAVPGGLDDARGWQSHAGIALPDKQSIRWWQEKVEAGARRPLPKVTWSFPLGTRLYDLLAHNGKAFELRMLKKTAGGWEGHTLWQGEDWPPGYRGVKATGRTCVGCHNRAGQWERYGPLVRGSDFIFSWSPMVEGTGRVDRAKPVKHWDEP